MKASSKLRYSRKSGTDTPETMGLSLPAPPQARTDSTHWMDKDEGAVYHETEETPLLPLRWNGETPVEENGADGVDALPERLQKKSRIRANDAIISRPHQRHHYATNKNKTYTKEFQKIIGRYDLNLDDDWNIDVLPHQGRHPNAYHKFILNEMKQIHGIANGNRELFLNLFESRIKMTIRKHPDMLYSKWWRKEK